MITYRIGRLGDINAVKQLVVELGLFYDGFVFSDTYIAEEKGTLIGLAHVRTVGKIKELTHVGVLPAYRGQGIARKLVDLAVKNTSQDLYLNTVVPDFFTHIGFEQTIDIPTQFNKPAGWCDECLPERCTAMVKRKGS